MNILIAGSGPAGAFAALGALQAGASVTLIDPGLVPEPTAQALKSNLAAKPACTWTAEDRAQLVSASGRLGDKRVFGSDFATRTSDPATRSLGCTITRSESFGGLSNVWGRGIEPPCLGEFEHWPFHKDFIASLREVLRYIPLAAAHDNLAEIMPLYCDDIAQQHLTAASQQLLRRWQRHQKQMNRHGLYFGATRLALNSNCQRCGMCFYGCTYDAMWDSTMLIAALQKGYPQFQYQPGAALTRFESTATGVIVTLNNHQVHEADRLILACGAATTTTLVLRTLHKPRATLRSSDLIKVPFLQLGALPEPEAKYHALSQLTLALKSPFIAKKTIVIHLFGRNPMIERALPRWLPRWIAARFLIGMCFLHSDDSTPISVLNHDRIITFHARFPFRAWFVGLKLFAWFLRHLPATGLLPLPGIPSLPGSSVHVGASLKVDATGQLELAPHVYIADAASLPEIPAGSYTLSIMANAHRIAKNAATH